MARGGGFFLGGVGWKGVRSMGLGGKALWPSTDYTEGATAARFSIIHALTVSTFPSSRVRGPQGLEVAPVCN